MEKEKNKVIIALSGGVDSSVCALLLKNKGYHVEAIHVKSWDSYGNNDLEGINLDCMQGNDYQDALNVCNYLEIKLHNLDLTKEYWKLVFQPALDKLRKGLTPNPDIFCNKFIKFGLLKEYVDQHFPNYEFATGHYAKLNDEQNILLKSKDDFKDQTYFLAKVKTSNLRNVIFPLQNFVKNEVRDMAKENDLITHNKKDSIGLCFVGERRYDKFLENYIKPHKGKIINILTNETIGEHKGYEFFSLGQNKDLNLGGQKEKMCVTKKDIDKNILFVAPIKHEMNFKNIFYINDINWIGKEIDNCDLQNIHVRIRHQGKQNLGKVNIEKGIVSLKEKVKGITPGQEAVFYKGERCLGGATIMKVM